MTQPVGSSLNVTQSVVWGSLDQRGLGLKTAMHLMPYNEFNNNAKQGQSRTMLYPQPLRATLGIAQTDDQSIQQKTQTISLTNPTNYIGVPLNQSWLDDSFSLMTDGMDEFWKEYGVAALLAIGAQENKIAVDALTDNFTDTFGDPSQPLNGVNTMTDLNAIQLIMGFAELDPSRAPVFGCTVNAFNSINVPTTGYFNQSFNSPVLNENLQMKSVKNFSGNDVYSDAQIRMHTNGTWAASGAITITSISFVGDPNVNTTLVLGGFTAAATVNVDDRFDITPSGASSALRYLLPTAYTETTYPKRFRVASVSGPASGGGALTITCDPIIGSEVSGSQLQSMWQNIAYDASTLAGAAITKVGTGSQKWAQNLFFTPKAGLYANPYLFQAPMKTQYKSAPYAEHSDRKIAGSNLTTRILLTSDGDQNQATNRLIFRSVATATAYQGYGCVYASIS